MRKIMHNPFSSFIACLLLTPVFSASAETESWYTYWALGISKHNYNPAIETFVDDAQNLPGSLGRSQGAADLFGFYWPVAETTLAGFVVSSSSDSVSKADLNEPKTFYDLFVGFPYISGASKYLRISQSLYAASAMHFFGSEPGDGFFVRGDVGIARLNIESELVAPIDDGTGYGILVGMGYGFPVSAESRLLIGIYGSYNRIGGINYTATSLRIGGLW